MARSGWWSRRRGVVAVATCVVLVAGGVVGWTVVRHDYGETITGPTTEYPTPSVPGPRPGPRP